MAKKEKPEEIEEEQEEEYGSIGEDTSSNGHNGKKDANIVLLEYLYNTRRGKIPELTDVPLDQVRPMSMMTTYADEVRLLCNDIIDAQITHFANWWAWHGKEYQQAHQLTTKEEALTQATNEMMQDFSSTYGKLLVSNWQYYYYQLRRSIGGEHARGAIVLAQDQLAAQQGQGIMSADELLERIQEQ